MDFSSPSALAGRMSIGRKWLAIRGVAQQWLAATDVCSIRSQRAADPLKHYSAREPGRDDRSRRRPRRQRAKRTGNSQPLVVRLGAAKEHEPEECTGPLETFDEPSAFDPASTLPTRPPSLTARPHDAPIVGATTSHSAEQTRPTWVSAPQAVWPHSESNRKRGSNVAVESRERPKEKPA